jgi:trehalose utilization protein
MDEPLKDIRAMVTACVADGTHSPDEISAVAATFAEEEHGLAGLRDLARRVTAEVLHQHLDETNDQAAPRSGKVVVEYVYCRMEVDGETVTLDQLVVGSSNAQLGAEAARRVAAALRLPILPSPPSTGARSLTWRMG